MTKAEFLKLLKKNDFTVSKSSRISKKKSGPYSEIVVYVDRGRKNNVKIWEETERVHGGWPVKSMIATELNYDTTVAVLANRNLK